ncbi:MAG: 7-cyano-7-deazaguanine synthase QueC [Candidatus Brocadiaceae bacterium]|nr:7-cyano-7-deazaguanine synthase QueC [Candidatus Brocadiaceae bacterium]
MKLAVVLLSGGMDSCVTTAIARQDHELALLHANYGQKTERRELKAFNDIAQYYLVPAGRRLVVDMHYLGEMGGSSLTDPGLEIPAQANPPEADCGYEEVDIPSTYVPFRNTHLLASAVSWAEVLGARKVFIGAVENDNPCYPDCREVYYKAINQLVRVGTRPDSQIVVEAPLLHLKKPQIVQKGMALGAPLRLSWSCYKNEDRACGTCQSCRLRLGAFKEAGYVDPVPYEAEIADRK